MNKTADNITLSNIFADGIRFIGVILSTALSFLITVACSISDFTQIFALMDSVQHESGFTVVVASVTICIFLNFSLYVAGTVIKRMVRGRTIGESSLISIICIVLGFLLFIVVFSLTFKFKYELRDHLFSVESIGSIDSVINKAVKSGVIATNNTAANDAEIIRISAILSGLMPAFTSILSLLSVFLFYDPNATEKAFLQIQRIFYKYRYFVTMRRLDAVNRELKRSDQTLQDYRELLAKDYENYRLYSEETKSAEITAKTSEYIAAIELFKADQDTVTRLSGAAKNVKSKDRSQPFFEATEETELPQILLEAIKSARKSYESMHSWTEEAGNDTDSTTRCKDAENSEHTPSDGSKSSCDSEFQEELTCDDSPISPLGGEHTFKRIDIPDSMVSPQLSKAVNQ